MEEDEEMQKGVRVYKNEPRSRLASESQFGDEELADDCPELDVETMLESLKLDMGGDDESQADNDEAMNIVNEEAMN